MPLRSLLLSCALLAAGIALAAPAHAAEPNNELGLELVPWSKKVGERRYESPRDFDSTVKFYKDRFKGQKTIKWTREVSLPSVKYIHIENTGTSSRWQGINIYALPDGRVRYYLLEREAPATAAAPKAGAPAEPR
jgi:hypothetical protein